MNSEDECMTSQLLQKMKLYNGKNRGFDLCTVVIKVRVCGFITTLSPNNMLHCANLIFTDMAHIYTYTDLSLELRC